MNLRIPSRLRKPFRQLNHFVSCAPCLLLGTVNRVLGLWRRPQQPKQKDIAITIVTYKRPNYLFRTLESFCEKNPVLRAVAPIYVLVQGTRPADTAETEIVLDEISSRWEVTIHRVFPDKNVGCGMGFTWINNIALASQPGYVIHLQDDWQSVDPVEIFLPECLDAFTKVPDLGAIRLRSFEENVLSYNVVTRRKIIYYPATANVVVGNAHFTFNPTIIRADVLLRLLPVKFEFHAVKRYHRLGYRVGQLRRRCFVHIGDQRVPDWRK